MDISQILENIVYLELLRRNYKVYVGREGKNEIDFIALKNKKKVYIQVTYLLASKETINREFRPLKNIDDNFPKYVLSMDSMAIEDKEGIKWVNIIDFLLENKL
jgi:predicted AAA+ superfamily ATPase